MESESKQVKQKMGLELEVLDILQETVMIYVKNINFIIFTLLTSLPFFCVMVYFEFLFQEIVVEAIKIIPNLAFYERYFVYFVFYGDTSSSDTDKIFGQDYLLVLIQLVFIYLVPLHVLELCSAIVTTNLASKLRSEENNVSLKQMFQNFIDISIMKDTFVTSLYMLFLSACLLIAFPWTLDNCYSFSRVFGGYIFFAVICFVALAKLLMIYLEWSAIWNMSIVISVLDGIYGIGALRVSYFFSRGNQKRGLLLMLVYFALGLCLRLSCLFGGCYKGGKGIFIQIGFLTVLNTLKWVSCVIYFHDCKERKMEKKVDEESGKDLANIS